MSADSLPVLLHLVLGQNVEDLEINQASHGEILHRKMKFPFPILDKCTEPKVAFGSYTVLG